MQTINISEIFGPTIQGEGALIGKPTVFVRTGGCEYRCQWCDTLYAVLPQYHTQWKKMTAEAIMQEIEMLSPVPLLVTLSGGNPAMQSLEPLLALGHEKGYTFCIETQGSFARPWFSQLDYLTLSPKPPSSGMTTNWEKLSLCCAMAKDAPVIVKVVVFDDADYMYAREVAERYPQYPLYLQTGNSHVGAGFSLDAILEKTRWLVEKVTVDQWNTVTVLPQFHTLLWGNTRGV